MSANCHDCGYRDTEIKSGGATAAMGRKITLKVEDADDLSRDILKVCTLPSFSYSPSTTNLFNIHYNRVKLRDYLFQKSSWSLIQELWEDDLRHWKEF